jgi:hypothetical protein
MAVFPSLRGLPLKATTLIVPPPASVFYWIYILSKSQ